MDVNWGAVALVGCGLALFFMLLGIFLFNQYRRLVRNLFMFSIISRVMDTSKEDINAEAEPEALSTVKHISREDIRARATSVDFDSALAKYRTPAPMPPAQAQQAPPPLDDDHDEDSRPLRPPPIPLDPRPQRYQDETRQEDDIYEDD